MENSGIIENIEIETDLNISYSNYSTKNDQVLQIYNDQVGGHHSMLCPQYCDDYIIKPAIKKELQFYEKMQQNRDDNKLSEFLPKYYGTTEINESTKIIIKDALNNSFQSENCNSINSNENVTNDNNGYIDNGKTRKMKWLKSLFTERHSFGRSLKLQNLTKDFSHPCVLDIKMGFTAPSEKHKLKFKNSTSQTHGFRICGLNAFWEKAKLQKTKFMDKYQGRQIKGDDLSICISYFFYDGEKIKTHIIKKFLEQLIKLKEALEVYKGFLFKSSSLLMVYNGLSSQTSQNQLNQQNILKNSENNNLNNLIGKNILSNNQNGISQNLSLSKQSSTKLSKQNSQCTQNLQSQQQCDEKIQLKLIDFANIEYTNSNRTDNELIDGIINLIDCLKNIMTWENQSIDLSGNAMLQKLSKDQSHQIDIQQFSTDDKCFKKTSDYPDEKKNQQDENQQENTEKNTMDNENEEQNQIEIENFPKNDKNNDLSPKLKQKPQNENLTQQVKKLKKIQENKESHKKNKNSNSEDEFYYNVTSGQIIFDNQDNIIIEQKENIYAEKTKNIFTEQ